MDFSTKQQTVLNTYLKDNTFFSLLSGAIRSGKSYIAVLAFFLYTQSIGNVRVNLVVGRNLRIMEVELLDTLQQISASLGSVYAYHRTKGLLEINGVKYIVIAAHDEQSSKRVQSLTAGSALIDEIQLLPESFINQLIARLSFADSKILATCNPEGARHWLKTKFIDTKKIGYLNNFTLDDNPTLPDAVKDRYRDMFTGVFYDRNILGQWVQAEGVIYKEYEIINKPIDKKDISSEDVGVDYGIAGITAYVKLTYLKSGICVITDGYRYNGEDGIKTDTQLADDLIIFIGKSHIRNVYIDPSAVSFIAELMYRKTKFVVLKGDNAVVPGIKTVLNGFGSKKLVILKNENNKPLINELTSYAWMPTEDDKPVKADDHHCDALRYGYYTRNKVFIRRMTKLPANFR